MSVVGRLKKYEIIFAEKIHKQDLYNWCSLPHIRRVITEEE
jgi:hypothetical protein